VHLMRFRWRIGKKRNMQDNQEPDGHGTKERWLGDPTGRLRNAAEGGSLDQTSRGYMPGTYERFWRVSAPGIRGVMRVKRKQGDVVDR